MEQGHDDGESFVAGADHADAAVRFGDVFHQPVDSVPGIGGVVGAARVVAGVHGRRRHEVGTFGSVFAADVLIDADVARLDEDFIAEREGLDHARALRSRGTGGGVVRRAGKEDRGTVRPFGDDDDGVELDAVAHGDHDDALLKVAGLLGGFEVGGQLVGGEVLLLGDGAGGCGEKEAGNGADRLEGVHDPLRLSLEGGYFMRNKPTIAESPDEAVWLCAGCSSARQEGA